MLDKKDYRWLAYNRKKDKKYRWKAVKCNVDDILYLMQESADVGISMIIEYRDRKYKIGVGADYDYRTDEFLDFLFHLDDQVFRTLDEFKAGAILDGDLFINAKEIIELFEYDEGNPKNSTYISEKL